MRKLLKYMKGYGKECVLGPLFKLLEASFELFIPLVVAAIVDTGIGNGDRVYVLKMCLVMILLGLNADEAGAALDKAKGHISKALRKGQE